MLTKEEQRRLNEADVALRQAAKTIEQARALILEMHRLLLQHAPIADKEVIAALALSYELVGD